MAEKDLASQMAELIEDYSEATEWDVREAVQKTAQDVREQTSSRSPVRKSKGGGKYKRAWRVKDDVHTRQRDSSYVYNSTQYRLTHLLQHGHGGPHPAKAYPHITQDSEAAAMFVKNLEAKLGG